MAKDKEAPASLDSGNEDMISHDVPVLELPLEERIERRSALDGILPDDVLDQLYGDDSRTPDDESSDD
jgi:hypothetical protein